MSVLDEVMSTLKAKYLAGEGVERLTLTKDKLWELHVELSKRGMLLFSSDGDGNSNIVTLTSPAGLTRFYPE